MHADIIEAFFLIEGSPFILLGSIPEEDLQLHASRITVQDVVGSEATGEEIETEILSGSYFLYSKRDPFLGAIHCKKSMSQYGARVLLERIMDFLEENKNFILDNYNSQYHLRHIRKAIDLMLGEKIPTSPKGILMADELLEQFSSLHPEILASGIITPESWPIIIKMREDETIGLSEFFWAEITNLIHFSDDNISTVELTGEKAFYALRKITIPLHDETVMNWFYVVKAVLDLKDTGLAQWKTKFLQSLDEFLIPALSTVIQEMVQQEYEFLGMEGILGEAIRAVYSSVESIIRANALYDKNLDYYGIFFKNENKMLNLDKIIEWIKANALEQEPSVYCENLKYPFTFYLVLDEFTKNKLFLVIDQIAIQFAKQGIFQDYSRGRPKPLQLGIGTVKELNEQNDHLILLLEQGVPMELHFQKIPNKPLPPLTKGMHVYREDAGLEYYRFSLLKTFKFTISTLFYKGKKYWKGILSTNPEVVDIIENRLSAFQETSET